MKRLAAAARAALSDPVIMGMAGLYLLTRALAALDAQAQATAQHLGEVQAQAAQILEQAAAVAAGNPYPYDTLRSVNGQPVAPADVASESAHAAD